MRVANLCTLVKILATLLESYEKSSVLIQDNREDKKVLLHEMNPLKGFQNLIVTFTRLLSHESVSVLQKS